METGLQFGLQKRKSQRVQLTITLFIVLYLGDVFGAKDKFKGLGIFLDTYANSYHPVCTSFKI